MLFQGENGFFHSYMLFFTSENIIRGRRCAGVSCVCGGTKDPRVIKWEGFGAVRSGLFAWFSKDSPSPLVSCQMNCLGCSWFEGLCFRRSW